MDRNNPLPCKCGAEARIRFKDPYIWVECKKKCGMRSGFHFIFISTEKELCTEHAIEQWNRMVQDDGRTKHIHQT